jgi:hypothetical protein
LKNLVRQLVDAGTRLARAGVAGDEPAATELIPPPNESAEFGNVRSAPRFQQQTNSQNHQQNSQTDHRRSPSNWKNRKTVEWVEW